ncbi:MAG TPA: GNAT family N-acetyltransferase [Kofleriaceae bacterium]
MQRERQLVSRRRAVEGDRPFLEEVHVAALGPVALVGYGWVAERLREQFHREVELANCEVILVDSLRAGYVSIEDRGAFWYIDAIAIAPKYQRKGVGSAALRDLLVQTGRVPVRLSVLLVNRARPLYRRLGFTVIASDGRRELMEYRPPR